MPAGLSLGRTGGRGASSPSPKYPLVAPLGTSLQGGGEGVGGVLSGPHLCHTTQPRAVAYSDFAHILEGVVRGKLCWGWGWVKGEGGPKLLMLCNTNHILYLTNCVTIRLLTTGKQPHSNMYNNCIQDHYCKIISTFRLLLLFSQQGKLC